MSEPWTDADIEKITTKLIALVERGDVLASAVENAETWDGDDGGILIADWRPLADAARAWRAALEGR